MQTQADISAAQAHAVVNFHSVGVILATAQAPWNDYSFKIGNDGNATTRHLSITVDCVPSGKVEVEPFDLLAAKTNNSVPDLIPPKGEITVPGPRSDCHFPLSDANAIYGGSKHFYFLGKITYLDGIDPVTIHTTEFAKELVIEDMSHAVSRGRHNCADKDCPADQPK